MAKEKKNAENTKNTAVSADETTEKAAKNKKAFNKRKRCTALQNLRNL